MFTACLFCPPVAKKISSCSFKSESVNILSSWMYFLIIHHGQLCVLYFRRVWQHITIQASTSRKSTTIALNYMRAWRPKLDRYGALLLFNCFNVWSCDHMWFILSSCEGSRLSSTRQCSNCFNASSSGWDEVPDDPHALACDGTVPHRTGESARTFPSAQHRQGLYKTLEHYTAHCRRFVLTENVNFVG